MCWVSSWTINWTNPEAIIPWSLLTQPCFFRYQATIYLGKVGLVLSPRGDLWRPFPCASGWSRDGHVISFWLMNERGNSLTAIKGSLIERELRKEKESHPSFLPEMCNGRQPSCHLWQWEETLPQREDGRAGQEPLGLADTVEQLGPSWK